MGISWSFLDITLAQGERSWGGDMSTIYRTMWNPKMVYYATAQISHSINLFFKSLEEVILDMDLFCCLKILKLRGQDSITRPIFNGFQHLCLSSYYSIQNKESF